MESSELFFTGYLSPYFESDPGPLQLSVGQILRAEVLSRKGDELVISLMGRRLFARTDLPLSVGDQIRISVTSLGKDGLFLKILSEAPGQMKPASEIQTPYNFEIRNDIRNLVVDTAQKMGLRISDASTSRITNFLTDNPVKMNESVCKLLVTTESLGLPLTRETLDSLELFLMNNYKISADISMLSQTFNEIKESLSTSDKNAVESLLKQIMRLTVDPQKTTDFKEALDRLGLRFEESIASSISEKGQASVPRQDLKSLLLELLAKIDNLRVSHDDQTIKHSLRECVQNLIRGQTAQQLLARSFLIAKRISQESIFLQLPIFDGQKMRTAQLKVTKDPQSKSRKIDPDNATLLFLLETANMGDVEVQLSVVNGHLECQVGVERDQVRTFLAGKVEELRKGLASTGYSVGRISAITLANLKKRFFEPLLGSFAKLDLKI